MGKENIVLYDWLSFTDKEMSPDEAASLLGLSHVPWSDTRGAHGYQSRKYYNGISIHYNGRDDMGLWVEMSGQGCRCFESYSDLEWSQLFSRIVQRNCNVTRLDVAFDDHTGLLDIKQVVKDTQDGNWVSRSNYWETILSSKGSTVQIGSPQSKVLVRIYDKAAERNCPAGEHWVRVELQLRDDRASRFMMLEDLTIGEAFSGVLLNYLRYVVPDPGDDNRWRWDMTDYWINLLEILTPISIFSRPGVEYNLQRCESYVFDQAGNAIDCYIKCVGINEFLRKLHSREVASNPKYDQLVKMYRFAKTIV